MPEAVAQFCPVALFWGTFPIDAYARARARSDQWGNPVKIGQPGKTGQPVSS